MNGLPAKHFHIQQAKHNRTFAETLDKDQYPDWYVTALFYCALHYVHALLAMSWTSARTAHPKRHKDLKKAVSSLAAFTPNAFEKYCTLETRCWIARYENWRAGDVSKKFTKPALRKLYKETFLPLVQDLQKLLT